MVEVNIPTQDLLNTKNFVKQKPISYDKFDHTQTGKELAPLFGTFFGIVGLVPVPGTVLLAGFKFLLYDLVYKGIKVETNRYFDNKLGYTVDRCVYKGTDDRIGNEILSENDNYLMVNFPTIERTDGEKDFTPEQIAVCTDYFEYSLEKIRQEIAQAKDRVVCINLPFTRPDISNSHKRTQEQLFVNRDIIPNEANHQVITLSKEEFEDFTLLPEAAFEESVKAIDDSYLSQLYELLQNAQGPEKKASAELAKRRIVALLNRELDQRINGHEYVIERSRGDGYDPIRKRVNPMAGIRQTREGLQYVRVVTETGETRHIKLEELIHLKNTPIDKLLASDSPYRKAQLLSLIHTMLSEIPLEELRQKRDMSIDAILLRMKEAGIDLKRDKSNTNKKDPTDTPDSIVHPQLETESRYKVKLSKRKFGKKIVKNIGTILLLSALIRTGRSVAENSSYWEEVLTGSHNRIDTSQSSGFPEGIPSSAIEWTIGGTLNGDGYYIESTAHEFENGQWETVSDDGKEIELPSFFDETFNHWKLTKVIEVEQFATTTFRPLIRENSDLAAVTVSDPDGNLVPYTIQQFVDGTFEISINPDIISPPPWVTVTTFLTPIETANVGVHASAPIEEINATQLTSGVSDEAQQVIDSTSSQPEAAAEFASQTQQEYDYSIDPPNKELLNAALSEEDFVNATENLDALSCSPANSRVALLSSMENSNNGIVNMAFGYIHSDKNGGASGGSIRSETYHGFMITDNGVVIDATPSNIADDEQTQQYINLLRSPDSAEIAAFTTVEQEAEKKKKFADAIRLMALLGSSLATTFGALQISRFLKKRITRETVEEAMDDILLSNFSDSEITQATSFFHELSWGSPNSIIDIHASPLPSGTLDKKLALQGIRDNLHYDKVESFLANKPHDPFTEKLQLLGKYLLNDKGLRGNLAILLNLRIS